MVHHFTIGRQKDFALASQEVIDLALRAVLGLELLCRDLHHLLLARLVGICVRLISNHSRIF